MKVSARAEYACLALIDLARRWSESRPVRLREIAEAQNIPKSTLNQIMFELKNAGLVTSSRGADGGYRLARPADQIRLVQVLHVIDRENGEMREPYGAAGHALATVWHQIREFERRVLAETSIAQLASEHASS
jgi:Rrf2 family cysteine metabolism transcriptional repressor